MEITVHYDYRESELRGLMDVEALAVFAIEREGKPKSTEMSMSFVTDEKIRELNRDYRGIDRATDVLSFECDNLDDGFSPESGDMFNEPYELGDLVIAPDVAQRQAPEYGLTFDEELSLLIVHGLLHLCGYDHLEDDEAQVMEDRERELLSEFWGRPFERSRADG